MRIFMPILNCFSPILRLFYGVRKLSYLVPVIVMIVMGLVLFLPAGSFMFWQAWILWSIFSVLTLFITAYFLKKDPGLLSRRITVEA